MTQPPLEALYFDIMLGKDPINTSDATPLTITYQYATAFQPVDMTAYYSGWTPLTSAEQDAMRLRLDHIESFLNVAFVETVGDDDPDLNLGKVSLSGNSGYGGASIRYSGTEITRWDGYAVFQNTLDLSQDSEIDLILHELGHALGLKHPHSDPVLDDAFDSNKYTVMSYASNPDNGLDSDAMMLFDVYALQTLWGAAEYNTGDDTYVGKRTATVDTIWDTGGSDTFDASGNASSVILDLNPGAFSRFGSYDDVVIAYGAEIENARGSIFADEITGNELDNRLEGLGGDDDIDAGAGGDVILGGAGNDVLTGGRGRDMVQGDIGRDRLKGGGGRDELFGDGGRDRLDGGRGDDMLTGGTGRDKFIFRKVFSSDTITDFEAGSDRLKFTSYDSTEAILSFGTEIGADVVFDFADSNILTVQNTTLAELGDGLLV